MEIENHWKKLKKIVNIIKPIEINDIRNREKPVNKSIGHRNSVKLLHKFIFGNYENNNEKRIITEFYRNGQIQQLSDSSINMNSL